MITLMRKESTTSACSCTIHTAVIDPSRKSAHDVSTSNNNQIELGDSILPSIPILNAAPLTSFVPTVEEGADATLSSVLGDDGCMQYSRLGTSNYVGSSHWAAVLDSIADLKEFFEEKEETRNIVTDFIPANHINPRWPQLLYGCEESTRTDILASIPPRRVVDRLVSRYFTDLDIAPGEFNIATPEYQLSIIVRRTSSAEY